MAPIRPATRWRSGRHSTWFATPTKGRNPVTALTNEVDEAALQCVINKTTQDGILWLPSGILYRTKPNISGELALVVRGVGGRGATTLLQTVRGQDGWHHGTAETGWIGGTNSLIYGSRFSVHGATLTCGGLGNQQIPFIRGAAIKAASSPATAGFTLSDINIAARGCRHESRLCCDSGVTDGLLGTEG